MSVREEEGGERKESSEQLPRASSPFASRFFFFPSPRRRPPFLARNPPWLQRENVIGGMRAGRTRNRRADASRQRAPCTGEINAREAFSSRPASTSRRPRSGSNARVAVSQELLGCLLNSTKRKVRAPRLGALLANSMRPVDRAFKAFELHEGERGSGHERESPRRARRRRKKAHDAPSPARPA